MDTPMKRLCSLLTGMIVVLVIFPSQTHAQISGRPMVPTPQTPPTPAASKPVTTSQASGTDDQSFNGSAAIGFMIAFPQHTFGDTLNKYGYGININAAYAPSTFVPFALGLDVGFMSYGNEQFTQPLGNGALSRINVDVRTNYNLVTGHTFLRVQPDLQAIMPYCEGLIGFHYLYTSSSVNSRSNTSGDQAFASSTNYDDIALSYGVGGGLGIKLYSHKPEYKNGEMVNAGGAMYIDMRVRYLIGGKAEYLRPGVSITNGKDANGNDIPIYTPSKTSTDILTAQIGVSFRF